MHQYHDEARTLRSRSAELAAELDRTPAEVPDGSAAMAVVTVASGSYPTVAGRYYPCQVTTVGGTEVTGGTPTFAAVPGTIYAANLGTAIPPVGTRLLVRVADGRWAFAYNG